MHRNQKYSKISNNSHNIYIGIDLAWGEKNLSGFCVLQEEKSKLKIVDIRLVHSIDEIILEIQKYKNYNIYVGIDAPLIVPNKTGNRKIEKDFNKDFAKYKISMLPVNRTLLTRYSSNIRSEELYEKIKAYTTVFEVYPHSTIAMLFNNHKILPYKRKKGRNAAFIKEQLDIYRNYLKTVIASHSILKEDTLVLKGQKVKDYEDKLDAITCAYTMFYAQSNEVKTYQLNGEDLFITPISRWKVYMLQCSDNSLYTGITTDLNRRVEEHNHSKLGAKYTKARRPVVLVYFENCDDRVSASQREYEIKQYSRHEKLKLL